MNPCNIFIVLNQSAMEESDRGHNVSVVRTRTLKIPSTDNNHCSVWLNMQSAVAEAERLAALSPTKVFTVMGSVAFVETSKPDVLHKIVTDTGEYVPKPKEVKVVPNEVLI